MLSPNGPLFAIGFRPFFLLCSFYSALAMALWLAVLNNALVLRSSYVGLSWHQHEMVFGFCSALLIGFLLTAVRNWTGRATPTQLPLAALSLLWLAGRIAPFLPLPAALIALIDLSFLPVSIAILAVRLIPAKKNSNTAFLLLLTLYWLGDLLAHASSLGLPHVPPKLGYTIGLDAVILFLLIMGGRIIPFFTQRAIAGHTPRKWPAIERLVLPLSALALGSELISPVHPVTALLLGGAGVIHLIRPAGWFKKEVLSTPLLWVLYLGYSWIGVGFLLKAAGALGVTIGSSGVHALTVGGIGLLGVGMISRVSLGHSGRPLVTSRLLQLSYGVIAVAALIRVFGPLLLPAQLPTIYTVSGLLWILGYALLGALFFRVWTTPRPDGKPG